MSSTKCAGTTQQGKPCQNKAVWGSKFCGYHDPKWQGNGKTWKLPEAPGSAIGTMQKSELIAVITAILLAGVEGDFPVDPDGA
jgi:hypothetical protein